MASTFTQSLKSPHAHIAAWNRHKREMQQRAAATALAEIAAIYAANRTDENRFDLCNAIIDLIDDGDAYAERETLMDELGWDEHGNPRPADREDYADYLYEQHRDRLMMRELDA